MRFLRLGALAAFLTLVLSGVSFAGQIDNLNFNSVGGASIGGEYVYPYYFYINGSSTLTPLLCDTYDKSITFGESWQAYANPLLSGQGLWMSEPNALKNYEAAAIIFGWILNATTVAGQQVSAATGNLAIWGLFDGGRSNSGWTQYEQTLINQALGLTMSQSLSYYAQFTVYTPTNTGPGGPQEFIGYNNGGIPPQSLPEPATVSILAGGIFILSEVLRRRKLLS
jgi:hypothetical protein